jgi:hypothetical protein
MPPRRAVVGFMLVLALLVPAVVRAVDLPISGSRLTIDVRKTIPKLIFQSKDPAIQLPAIGSPEDPRTVGLEITLVSAVDPQATLVIPATGGEPGWKAGTGDALLYKYSNKLAPGGATPVRAVLLKAGKGIKILARGVGLPMQVPAGLIGIRITIGSLRQCTRFASPYVKLDAPEWFDGRNAPAPAIPDCSDDALLDRHCGAGTYPTCGGSCPFGETCLPDGGISTCRCVPATCGSIYDPVCVEGECPADGVCALYPYTGCRCVFPVQPCGGTFPVCNGTCPAGDECVQLGEYNPLNGCGCLPVGSTPCGNPGLPTCGGDCPTGSVCGAMQPYDLYVTCGCIAPTACDGLTIGTCPPGQYCELDPFDDDNDCRPLP